MSQLPSEYRILEVASQQTPDTNIFIIISSSSLGLAEEWTPTCVFLMHSEQQCDVGNQRSRSFQT